ncbi:MAG: calcium-binding protein, partial [Pedobacter sp.]
ISYTLGANLEKLTLTGTAAINGTGNALNNVITGNSGNNILNGGVGADTMIGGTGKDTYTVDNAGDVVTETSTLATEIDTVNSSISYTLGANLENLALTGTAAINATGNALNNILAGNSGNNILNGGVGADTMIGGTGNDTYTVDNKGDVVTETSTLATEIDTVNSSISYTLGANLEKLTLTGTAAINATGNALNNILTGNSGNNILTGGVGNDTINGGVGVDTMVGGTGNDTYTVDNKGDVVTETSTLATEIDTVNSSISYTLGANLENLTLTGTAAINGTGNALNNILAGNSGNNILTGGAGNDTINGGVGADTMIGGTGKDTYTVDNTGDVVTETSTLATEIDTVNSSSSYTLGANLENLALTGTAAINATGNALNNILAGNSGNNILNGGVGNDTINGGVGADTMVGGTGNDTMIGGTGNDTMIGGTGNDTYLFNIGDKIDTLTDSAGNDFIKLGNAVNKNKVAFFKNTSGIFSLDYGNSTGIDKVAVNSWNTTANQIEKVQLNDGTFITNTEINTIIQNMTSYATSHSIALTSVEDVKNNSEIMSLYMNNSWHN